MATVDVIYHKERDGSWWAESPQVEGFTVVGDTLGEVRELVFDGVPFYLDVDEVDIRESQAGGAPLVVTDITPSAWSAPRWWPSDGAYSGTIQVGEPEQRFEWAV